MTTLRCALGGSVFAVAVAFLAMQPAAAQDNHYACYQIKANTSKINGVSLVDDVTTQTADKCKLKLLCVPVNKNGSGIPDPTANYLCWQCKGAKPSVNYAVTDQFVSGLSVTTKKLKYICNPAPPPQTITKCPGSTPPCSTVEKSGWCYAAGFNTCVDDGSGGCKCM